jgi:uncharacterized protein (DUF1778 family)
MRTVSSFGGRVLILAAIGELALGTLPLNPIDTGFALDWGRELAHGTLPDVRDLGASTPHPLSIASGLIASLAGPHALDVMQALVLLAASAVVLMLIDIGRAVRLPLVGLAAACVLLANGQFLFSAVALAAPADIPALAAVMGALVLELRRPRRGYAPLCLLAAAGLWRPEVWLLSGAYAAYCAPAVARTSRLRLAALTLIGPAVWLLSDLALTGDPLYSLTYTRWATAVAARPRGIGEVPSVLWSTLTRYFSAPVLVAAGLGVLIDLRGGLLPRVLPAWCAFALIAFAAIGATSLPVLGRYALPTVVATALYAGLFLGGWSRVPRGWARRAWQVAAGGCVALMLSGAPAGLEQLVGEQRHLNELGRLDRDLAAVVGSRAMRSLVTTCPPLQTSYQIVPLLAFDLGTGTASIVRVNAGIPDDGIVVQPARAQSLFEAQQVPPKAFLRRGFALVAESRDWLAFARCGPRGTRAGRSPPASRPPARLSVPVRPMTYNTAMASKTERLSLRLTPKQDVVLRRAAEARGESTSDYVLRHAVEAAELDLADRRVFVLDDAAWDELQGLLSATPSQLPPAMARLLSQQSVLERPAG